MVDNALVFHFPTDAAHSSLKFWFSTVKPFKDYSLTVQVVEKLIVFLARECHFFIVNVQWLFPKHGFVFNNTVLSN